MSSQTMECDWLSPGRDRRRIPRYACSGAARIACLPLVGAVLRGRLRDLGLGGCWIEEIQTPLPFDLGTQAEILVKVNSWAFRVMGHVRALRNCSGISVEFARMSAGGYNMLTDVIAELERPPAIIAVPQRLPGSSEGLLLKAEPVTSEDVTPGLSSLVPIGRAYPLRSSLDIFV